MSKPLDLKKLFSDLRVLLISRGPLSAAEACSALGISQASFSRLAESAGHELLILGRARRTRYALRKKIPQVGDQIPLYLVTEKGRVIPFATLHSLEPKGFYLEPKSPGVEPAIFGDLPYFLDDLRPDGFLGRLVPRAYPDLEAPSDIRLWSVEDCFRYWTRWGWNLIGNFLIGEKALRLLLELPKNAEPEEPGIYPRRAEETLLQGEAGSSAGGEQPKFLVERTSQGAAALVKFSPPLENGIARRVADLLACEHLAHEVLRRHGIETAHSRLLTEGNRVFLEIERFDRTETGRHGMLSLKALSLEHAGTLQSWTRISEELLREKQIDAGAHGLVRRLDFFGEMIANTDRHAGNLSFFVDEALRPTRLAPVYDMLPMMYSPRQNQLLDSPYEPRLPLPEEATIWDTACRMALEFWSRASSDEGISPDFRAIADRNSRALLEKKTRVGSLL